MALKKLIGEILSDLGFVTPEQIEAALQEQRKKHLQAGQLRKSAMQQAARLQSVGKEQRVATGLPQEQAVRSLLAQGNLEGAKLLLLQLVDRASSLSVRAEGLSASSSSTRMARFRAGG